MEGFTFPSGFESTFCDFFCTLKENNSGEHVCLLCFANYSEESFASISINTAVILGLLLTLLKRNKNEVIIGVLWVWKDVSNSF